LKEENKYQKDERIERILNLLLKYTMGDYSERGIISDKRDEIDAITIGLNTLAEEAEASGKVVRDYEKRVNSIMNVLLRYTLFDFSEKIPVGDIGDELDAISIGLNTMAEELESAREVEKQHLKAITESEERFRLLVEQVKDYAIITLDVNGNITSWNSGAESIKGYKANEIIGKNFSIFYTPEEIAANEPRENLKHALEQGHYEAEGWRVKKDGSLFWANIVYTPLYTADGKLKGFSKVTRDMTQRKKAEEELKRTNNFLDMVLEHIPNMVFVKDAKELRFVRFNKAGEELLGFKKEDLIGKNDYDFFPKDQADFFTQKDREVMSSSGITDIPEEPIDTSAGKKWLHTKKIPIPGKDGKPAYLLGISEDITRRKANEEKIRKLNTELQHNITQLEASNNELEAFTYSVSHDLRAPLRAIHGYTKILESEYKDKLDDDAKQMMEGVMHNAIKMGRLIDDLLALSRYGKKEMKKKATDLTELANQALEELKKNMSFGNAQTTIHPLGKAVVDPGLMFQVFINLIGNAIKYSSQKEKPVIEVGYKEMEGETIYFVKDNGSGFDMKYYDKLFGVFQRLHDASEFEGTGVGLALVKRIVNRHDGRVWAEAEPDKGATFYFTLKPKDNIN
jgi:PAS domain S-box-containing protein